MKRQICWFALTGAGLITACVATKPVVTSLVSDTGPGTPAGYFYSLPRTAIRVDIRVQHVITIPGPYARYAAKFLGITDAVSENRNEWAITGASIQAGNESDPQFLFCVQPALTDAIMPSLSALEKQGYLLAPGLIYATGIAGNTSDSHLSSGFPAFTDLSSARYFSEDIDTIFKTVLKDSKYIRVPTIRKEIEQKTPELKAQEAANFIIKIRKRRFKLLSGQYNFITEGAALEVTVREMNKLEEAYLSLFIGKQVTEEQSMSFYYIPDKSAGGRADVLCRFSEETGILPAANKPGQPVLIRVLDENDNTDSIAAIPGQVAQALYYRIPGNAAVSVACGEQVLTQCRLSVAQFGPVITLPLPAMKKKLFGISLH